MILSSQREHMTIGVRSRSTQLLAKRGLTSPLLPSWEVLCDEREGDFRYLLPTMVNRQGMAAILNLLDLRDRRILELLLVGGVGYRPRDGMVLRTANDE